MIWEMINHNKKAQPVKLFPHSLLGKSKARHDNSLSVLTKKFVKLIRGSQDHTIDLNDAVRELAV